MSTVIPEAKSKAEEEIQTCMTSVRPRSGSFYTIFFLLCIAPLYGLLDYKFSMKRCEAKRAKLGGTPGEVAEAPPPGILEVEGTSLHQRI